MSVKHGLTGTLAFDRYLAQAAHCRTRGIPFEFGPLEWIAWWEEHLGPDWLQKRGRKRGQYVMARLGDKGPYSPINVKCILSEDNCSERKINGTDAAPHKKARPGALNGNAKLTEDQVIEIFRSKLPKRALSRKYKIARDSITAIKNGTGWIGVTQGLSKECLG